MGFLSEFHNLGFLSPGILSLGILSVGILSAGFLSCGVFVTHVDFRTSKWGAVSGIRPLPAKRHKAIDTGLGGEMASRTVSLLDISGATRFTNHKKISLWI